MACHLRTVNKGKSRRLQTYQFGLRSKRRSRCDFPQNLWLRRLDQMTSLVRKRLLPRVDQIVPNEESGGSAMNFNPRLKC